MAALPPRAGSAADAPSNAMSAVVAAVFLWSITSFTVRAADAPAAVFVMWRAWMAVVPLWLLVRLRGGDVPPGAVPERIPARRDWLLIGTGGGALFLGGAVAAFAATTRTTLLDVAIIGALQPVLIIAIAVSFMRERFEPAALGRAALAIGGTVLVVLASRGEGTWSMAGDLLAVLGLLLNTGWYLFGRWVRTRFDLGPVALMLATLLSASVLLTVVLAATRTPIELTGAQMGWAALTMLAGTLAHILVVWAHRWVPASSSSVLLLAQPALVALGGWVLFSEAMGPAAIVGSAIVLGALAGMVRSESFVEVDAGVEDPEAPR